MEDTSTISLLIEQLTNKSSVKRRAAAKKLRKLKSREAGTALLQALEKEIKDPRTWETQYHMIMALANNSYFEAMTLLQDIAQKDVDATMVHVATGDAITTLEYYKENIVSSLPIWITSDKNPLVEGSIRALAMNKINPGDEVIREIIQYVEIPNIGNLDFWVAAACPGWPSELTNAFLNDCLKNSQLRETKKAAAAALCGKYLKWNPA